MCGIQLLLQMMTTTTHQYTCVSGLNLLLSLSHPGSLSWNGARRCGWLHELVLCRPLHPPPPSSCRVDGNGLHTRTRVDFAMIPSPVVDAGTDRRSSTILNYRGWPAVTTGD